MTDSITYTNSENTQVVAKPQNMYIPQPCYNSGQAVIDKWLAEGNTIAPYVAPTPSQKQIRDEALQALTYDFGDGRVMQTRPQDETNIRVSIDLMLRENIPTKLWTMVDNVKYPVTAIELETAYHAGQLAASAIWDNYTPE